MRQRGQIRLIDPATPLQEEIILFHDHTIVLLVGIFCFVALLGFDLIVTKFSTRKAINGQRLETIWTIVPAFLLLWLALPSLRLLYILDERSSTGVILKRTGHQWYWSYEAPCFGAEYDSYILADLEEGIHRNLEVDNRALVYHQIDTTVVTTSADVLHAWTVPAMGVKIDAVPGRLNSITFFTYKPGIFYGQCSEICGANHRFMPICLQVEGEKRVEKEMPIKKYVDEYIPQSFIRLSDVSIHKVV